MKTRRILAASTAALLSFGAVAVVANAARVTEIPGKTFKISLDGGATYVTVGGKVDDGGNEVDFNQNTITEASLTGTFDTDLKISISLKDAKKLKGVWAVKGKFVEVPEDDDEKVAVDEDEIKNLGLSDENKKILAKTAASKVKIAKITIGKDGKTSSTITKPLTITVAKTFAGAKVYHVNSDGSVTLLKSDTTESFVNSDKETTFSTTQFSPFIITTADLKATKASTDDTSSAAATTSNGGSTTNPDTGIALAIAPVVLAAGAVAVVALKKKH